MQLHVSRALITDVLLNARLVAVLPDCAHEVSCAPELSAPELLFDLRACSEDFSGRNAFDDLDDSLRTVEWHRLNQKMHMVLIRPNLQEADFIPLADLQAGLPELLVHIGSENHSSILGRADDVIQQN